MRACCVLIVGAVAVCSFTTPVEARPHGVAMVHGRKAAPVPPAHTAVAVNPIASKIASHPQLNAKITALLPPHTTLNQASAGFKNQGQFIAALHVSHNLGIPFKALKADMTVRHMSLGRSIQDLRHTSKSSATTQASKAEHEADLDQATVASTPGSRVGR
jgi:hypothetical protein